MTVAEAPPPFRIAFDTARDPYTARNALGIAGTGAGLITSVTAPLSVTGGTLSIDLNGYQLPNSGRLTFVSATQLAFKPYNGDRIKINGTIYAIPSGGIAGLTNGGLSANTTYYVYAFNSSGTITGEFSATAHVMSATAGNVGIEVKSGDDTRSLIGLIRTNASSQFVNGSKQRFVVSWLNRMPLTLWGGNTSAAVTTSTTHVELTTAARTEFVTWGDFWSIVTGSGSNSTANLGVGSAIMVDGALMAPTTQTLAQCFLANVQVTCGGAVVVDLAEGYHYATPSGLAYAGGTATISTSLYGSVNG